MEYIIFNESSIPFKNATDVNNSFPIFIEILSEALNKGFKAIRVANFFIGWYQMQLTENMVVGDWLGKQSRNKRQRIKSLLSKTRNSYIPPEENVLSHRFALSSFSLLGDKTCETPALGACFLSKQLAISCNSDEKWNSHCLEITGCELLENEEFANISGKVRNCTSIGHLNFHIEKIKQERNDRLIEEGNLWNNRTEIFPNLIFCGDTENQLTKLSISKHLYSQLYNVLRNLNDYCCSGKSYSISDLKESTSLDISDESITVKNNPKLMKQRKFRIDGNFEFFGYHVKNFSETYRLHFFPKTSENKIYIGYFGSHLSTMRFK